MGPEFENGDGRLRPSRQQRLPGAEGPPEGRSTAPRHAASGGPYSTLAGAGSYSCQTSAISAGRQRLSEGHHALPGPPDGAGLLLMDPAEVPDQSEWR